MHWIIKGVLVCTFAVFIFLLWACLVLASEDDDREGRG